MNIKYSIVVPVFNNENTLYELDEKITLTLRNSATSDDWEIIYVDDGSSDKSYLHLLDIKEAQKNVKIIKHSRNFGANNAVKTGLSFAEGSVFIVMAADLQDPPHLLSDLIDEYKNGERLVICVRRKRSDPIYTRVNAGLFYALLRRTVLPRYPKGGYDMMLFDQMIKDLIVRSSRVTFLSYIPIWSGIKFKEILYDRPARPVGKSGWTFFKSFNAAVSFLLSAGLRPIRLLTLTGLCVAAMSIIYASYIIFESVTGYPFVPGFATLVVLLSLLFSFVIIMLAVVGEYIGNILVMLDNNPHAIIEETHLK